MFFGCQYNLFIVVELFFTFTKILVDIEPFCLISV